MEFFSAACFFLSWQNINEAIGFVTFPSIEFKSEVKRLPIKVVCAISMTLIGIKKWDVDNSDWSAFLKTVKIVLSLT